MPFTNTSDTEETIRGSIAADPMSDLESATWGPIPDQLSSIPSFCRDNAYDADILGPEEDLDDPEEGVGDPDLPVDFTATLYSNAQGFPDIRRLENDTGLIAITKLPEYPLPDYLSLRILYGNEDGFFSIDEKYGYITFIPFPDESDKPEDPVHKPGSGTPSGDGRYLVGDDPRVPPARRSTFLRDLAASCPTTSGEAIAGAEEMGLTPESFGKETWDGVRKDPEAMAALEEEMAAEEEEQAAEEEGSPQTTGEESGTFTVSAHEAPPTVQVSSEEQAAVSDQAAAALGLPVPRDKPENLASAYRLVIGILASGPTGGSNVTKPGRPSGGYGAGAVNKPSLPIEGEETTAWSKYFQRTRQQDCPATGSHPLPEGYESWRQYFEDRHQYECSGSRTSRSSPYSCCNLASALQLAPLPVGGIATGIQALSYCITINIEEERVVPEEQLPTEVSSSSASTGCVQTVGDFGTGFSAPLPGTGLASGLGYEILPDDGFRATGTNRAQMVLAAAHHEWEKSVVEPGSGNIRRLEERGFNASVGQVTKYVYKRDSDLGVRWHGGPWDPDDRYDWCGAFAAYCYGVAGLKKELRQHGFASTNRLQSSSRWRDAGPFQDEDTLDGRVDRNPRPNTIAPGDVICIGPSSGTEHVQIVERVDDEGRGVFIYDGNASGWIYGLEETEPFGGEGRNRHGVTKNWVPFREHAEGDKWFIHFSTRPKEEDYYPIQNGVVVTSESQSGDVAAPQDDPTPAGLPGQDLAGDPPSTAEAALSET